MILSWYRRQLNDFGVLPATWLLWHVCWRRVLVLLSNRFLPCRVECPCCGWKGRRFFDYIEMGYTARNAACPSCDSHSRHRALFLWLRDQYRLDEKEGVALILAPEKALASLWAQADQLRTYKMDIEPSRGVDLQADVVRLPFASESVNLIWCHHVLEQVMDDRRAMSEFFRVLNSSSGELVISAGLSDNNTTREFGYSNKALSGNRRSYGQDFVARLRESGFAVERLSCELSPTEREKLGIIPEPFFRCTKDQTVRSKYQFPSSAGAAT